MPRLTKNQNFSALDPGTQTLKVFILPAVALGPSINTFNTNEIALFPAHENLKNGCEALNHVLENSRQRSSAASSV